MPMPYTGKHETNILIDWMSMLFWARDKWPDIYDSSSQSALYCRVRQALIEGTDNIEIEDLPMSTEDCAAFIKEFLRVYQMWPEVKFYWMAMVERHGKMDTQFRQMGIQWLDWDESKKNFDTFNTKQIWRGK